MTGGFSGTVDTSGGGVVTFVNPLIVPATPGSTTNGRLQNFTLNRLRYTNTSLVRASNIVTVTPSSPLTYAPQVRQIIGIYGSVGTASFNGLFNVCGTGSGCSAPSATSFQYLQTAGNETASNAGFLVVSDGAAGIDFGGSYNNQVFNVTVGWPDIPLKLGGTSQGSYYNDFYHSEFVAGQAANIAFGRSANQNEFYSVKFGPQTAFNMVGAYLDSSCVNNSFYSPDTEGGGVGLTAYIGGCSNSFYSAYAEAVSSPPIVIDATASFITVMGGIGNTVQDNGGAWAYNQVWNPGGTTTLPASPPGANYPQFFQAQYLGVSGAQQMFGLGPLSSNATTAPVVPRAMASCSRTSNVVTCILTGATQPGILSPLPRAPAIGQQLIIKNTTAAGATNFNGNFNVCDPASVAGCVTPSTATFSYAQTAGTDTATGGEVDLIDSMEAKKIYFAAHTAGSSATQVQSARNDSGSEYYLPGVNGGLGYLEASGVTQPGDFIQGQVSTPGTPTVVSSCSSSNTWSYEIVGRAGIGTTVHSAAGSATTGCAISDGSGSNQNTITWATSSGAISYDVYLTAFPGGATCGGSACATGKIASAQAQSYDGVNTFTHTTQNGDSSSPPSINTTGQIEAAYGFCIGASCITAWSGGGTVTSFSAGNLSPLFTTSVATATSTPALSFTLSNAAAYTLLGNNTGSSAGPTYVSFDTLFGSCSGGTNALTYNTSTHAFGCNTISGSGNVSNSGSPAQYQTPVWVDSTHIAGVSNGKTGQFYTSANNANPAFNSATVAEGNGGSDVTSTSYKIQCDSSTAVIDRATTVVFASGAVTPVSRSQ